MPRGHALGMVSYLPEVDKYDMTKQVSEKETSSFLPNLPLTFLFWAMVSYLPEVEQVRHDRFV